VAGTDAYEAPSDTDAGSLGGDDPTVADTPAVSASEMPPPAPVDPTVVSATPPPPEATAAWPATPGAPAAPTPPPPYVATGPVGPSDGGSKKGLLIGGGILAAVVIAVIAFLTLGGDDDKDLRTELATAIRSGSDLSEEEAACAADFYVDVIGEDEFDGVDFDAEDPPPEIALAFVENREAAIERCDLDPDAFGGTGANGTDGTDSTDDGAEPAGGEEGSYGSDPELDELYDQCEGGDFEACDDLFFDSPTGSEYEDFGDTCGERNEPSGTCVSLYEDGGDSSSLTDGLTDTGDLPADFGDILADTYEESLGLSREKAECLADALSADIESGELDEAEAMSAFMDYLSDCDISLEEIGGN